MRLRAANLGYGVVAGMLACLLGCSGTGDVGVQPGRLSVSPSAAGGFDVGAYKISLHGGESASLKITGPDGVSVLRSLPGEPFVTAASRTVTYEGWWHQIPVESESGNCDGQSISAAAKFESDSQLMFKGKLACTDGALDYTLEFAATENRLSFDIVLGGEYGDARDYNRVKLAGTSTPDEGFFGFGSQFSFFDMKGKRLRILITEQGFGRGDEPTTSAMNRIRDSGGEWWQTYASVPQFITSSKRGLHLDNTEISIFDMTEEFRFSVEVFAPRLRGEMYSGANSLELIEAYTDAHGRMRALPDWIQKGAVIGMQGGTDVVRAKVAAAQAAGVPIPAVWLQDWVGQRTGRTGAKRLLWSWSLNHQRYPGWKEMVADFADDGIRVMTYINPHVADLSSIAPQQRPIFAEGVRKGFFVKNQDGEPYLKGSPEYRFALVDFTNPDAWAWYKSIIKEELIASGASGWMADFAEGLPMDAVLFSGVDPESYHNQYADDWARLNREAIEEAGLGRDAVIFHRAGFSTAQRYATLFWLGDQQVEWGRHDGIKSAITGMSTSGVSGYSFNHSDIGGYTAFDYPTYKVYRSKQLFMRWAEMAAFSPVFRTHEGSFPHLNHQFDGDSETLAHFAAMAQVYACLAPYRRELSQLAASKGWPLVRHPYLHYPDDEEIRKIIFSQFLLGDKLMVVPVLDEDVDEVNAYIPEGEWVHIWSGNSYEKGWHTVAAPMGKPPAFAMSGSELGRSLLSCLE